MKAMIFAAGLGTRLKPMTDNLPKALVIYKSKPLLQYIIEKIAALGINDIVVNVHHFGVLIQDFLAQNKNFGLNILLSDERDLLLDTGGGLFKAQNFLANDNFIVHNVDIMSELNLNSLIEHHINSDSLATLAVQNRKTDKRLYFDNETKSLTKWKNEITGQEKIAQNAEKLTGFAYSGIFVAEPKIFQFMHSGVYSIIDTFLKAAQTEKITYFDHSGTFWRDMGKPESFLD